jgi:hypothetical protein
VTSHKTVIFCALVRGRKQYDEVKCLIREKCTFRDKTNDDGEQERVNNINKKKRLEREVEKQLRRAREDYK